MAQYPKLRTTNKGRELIASANGQKKAIEYTKAVIGDGDYNGSVDTLLDVVSPKMECSLISGTHEDNQYNLTFTVGNQNLNTGFFAKEIGIYGKIEGSSNEVLFAYTNGGTLVDYIPDKTVPIDAQTVSAYISVGDAEQVVIKKVDGTYITLKQLSDHNSDPNAHGGLITKVKNEVKVATDALATHNTADNAHAAKFAKYIEKAKLSITSGEVVDGGIVPIPSGFARNECTVLVSLKSSNVAQGYFDIRESGISTALQTECSYDSSTGKVHVGLWVRGTEHSSLDATKHFDGAGDTWYKGTATYICIAQKV